MAQVNQDEDFPRGIITLVFTDIENYSMLEREYRAALQPVLDEHNRLLRDAVEHWQGLEVRIVGDAFFLVFANPSNAVQFTVEAQRALREHEWTVINAEGETATIKLRVRMGMHTGDARFMRHPNGAPDYFGTEVNRAARIGSASHGGQILLSEATRILAQPQLPSTLEWRDLGLHRLKGVGEERLWQIYARGLESEFPRPATLDPQRHNLPLPQNSFVGRESQLNEWTALLRHPQTRLITITGFGGMGKTRLAQQLAELCFDDFKDGVWWVPLENAQNEDQMIDRIVEQLRIHLEPQPSVREQLWHWHRDRQLLLLLDNIEQIQPRKAPANVVFGLLNAGPQVKCIVTSRRSLNLQAERLVELTPMPDREAQNLFLERARARRAHYAPSPQDAHIVEQICDKLEGVPLAVELVASRAVMMAPTQILKQLDNQLNTLAVTAPDRPPRQLAVKVTIDWSYNLLSDSLQALFDELAVFAGSFTAEAVEAICAASVGAGFDIFSGLQELREHSLLRCETDPMSGLDRLLMLRVVRRYAQEKLDARADAEQARQRHALYFLDYARERIERLRTHEDAAALNELELEFDNLRAALDWAAGHDPMLCAQLAPLLFSALHLRGLWPEAQQRLKQGWKAAEKLTAEGRPLRAALHYHLASLADDLRQRAEARVEAEAALADYFEIGDDAGAANVLNLLGHLGLEEKDMDEARQCFETALSLWPVDDHIGRAKTLHNLGRLEALLHHRDEARRFYQQSLAHKEQTGDERGMAVTLGNLGTLAQEENDYETARDLYRRSLELRRKVREPLGIAIMLNNLGDLATLEGNMRLAVALLVHAERLFDDIGSPYAQESGRALAKLERQLGKEIFITLRHEAERTAWQQLV